MAQIPCQFDDGNAAVFIGTNLDTGETVTLCPPDLVSWCATIVEGMTGVPVSALIDAAQSGELVPDGGEVAAEGDGNDNAPSDDSPGADTVGDEADDSTLTQ